MGPARTTTLNTRLETAYTTNKQKKKRRQIFVKHVFRAFYFTDRRST